MKQIEIVGGGLSGLSLGVYLRRLGVPVRVLEAGNYPRHKVCGEFVCGVGDNVLQEMGIKGVFTGAIRHESMAWWMGNDLVMRDCLPQQALGLSRFWMDAELARLLVAAGGELMTGKRVGMEDAEGRVWAAGKRKRKGNWIGLKVHVRGADLDGLEMHVGKRGYLGVCGVEGGRANCCGLFRVNKGVEKKNLLASYLQANGLDQLHDRFCRWHMDMGSMSATAGFSLGAQQRVGAFCVGDAAMLIPPFTGNGMSMAIESAWLAGKWLAKFSRGELAWSEACSGYAASSGGYFKKRMRLAGSLHPFLFNGLGRGLLKLSARGGVLPFGYLSKHLRT